MVMKHKSGSNERTFLILVFTLERSASASKPPQFKKQHGMLWAMSANINLSVPEASTHTGAQRQHVKFLTVYKQWERRWRQYMDALGD